LRFPMKNESLSEFREVYQATSSKKMKYPNTNPNNTIGDILND